MTTIHTWQLQQYTRPTNNNYTQDNLKLATIHMIQIRIFQHVQKVKTPKQDSTVYSFLSLICGELNVVLQDMHPGTSKYDSVWVTLPDTVRLRRLKTVPTPRLRLYCYSLQWQTLRFLGNPCGYAKCHDGIKFGNEMRNQFQALAGRKCLLSVRNELGFSDGAVPGLAEYTFRPSCFSVCCWEVITEVAVTNKGQPKSGKGGGGSRNAAPAK